MNQILLQAVKDLLVAANTGEEIATSLLRLEQSLELLEPGWHIEEEVRRRYRPENPKADIIG